MIVRFRVLSPGNSGAPDYFICGQAAAVVNNLNLGAKLYVDGELIWDTNDLSTYVFPAPIVTPTGFTVTSIGIQNADFYTFQIDIPEVWMQASVDLQLTKAGYITYHNVYTVFGYDLGNNPNQLDGAGNPVDHNPDMDVRLINETDNVVNGEQTRAYSSFTGYYKPFTNDLYVYKLDSSGGLVSYRDGSDIQLLNTRNGVICGNPLSIKQVTTLMEGSCGCGHTNGIEDECISALQSYSKLQDTPNIGLTVGCTDCVDGDCTTFINTNVANPSLDVNVQQLYWVDDDLEYAYDNLDIEYSVANNIGNVISSNVSNIPNILPVFAFDPTLYFVGDLPLPEVGDYLVCMKVSHTFNGFKVFECVKCVPVHVCHWYEIKKEACNKFRVYNHSFLERTVVVSKLTAVDTWEQVSSTAMPLGTNTLFTLGDGVYKFEMANGDITYTYIVIVYCGIQACIIKYLTDIICCKPQPECADTCKLYYDFNALILNVHTFFAALNSEYNFAFIYEALTPNKLAELFDLKLFIDNAKRYCKDCNSGCAECGGSTTHSSHSHTKTGGCGCGCK